MWFPLLVGIFVAAQAQSDGGGLTPHRVAALRVVDSAALSPDGTQVAYTLSVPRTPFKDDDGNNWVELHLVAFAGGASRPFVTGEVNVSGVKWTPDGKAITFIAKRGKDEFSSLHRIPVDGGEARRLFALKSDVLGYSLSPDGKRAAVIAVEPEREDRKKAKDKGFKQEVFEEDWRRREVYLVALDRAADRTDEEPRPLKLDGNAFQVHWSPVDDRLAVALAPTPLIDDSYMRQRVRVVNANTGEVLARIENAGKLGEIAWSPDGSRLSIIAAADVNDPSAGRLMVAPAAGGELTELMKGADGDFPQAGWRDAQTIAFVMARGTRTALETARADGSSRAPWQQGVALASTGLSLARNGSGAALVASSRAHPAEVYAIGAADQEPRRLTDSNPWLASVKLAPQETITFKARDGLELDGVLVHPLEAKGPAPLILAVHGGPEAHVSDGWLTSYGNPGQAAAARGFAVFYPNYRGGTGRGVAFAKLSQGDPAGKEFDDLVDAVDALVARELVDKNRVGITGASYGGYATAWCATRFSDRFKAGVMMVGISNKLSKIGTTDIPEEEYLVHARKRPWEDWTFFLERSPVYEAGNCRTAMLIMHGKDDPRVNVGQSRELYRRLKIGAQAPVRLVLYPGEEHGNRKAAAKLDFSLRLLQWMEHYVAGPGGDPPPYELDYTEPKS